MLATHNSTGAVTYRVTDLGTLDTEPTGSHVSEAFAVNDLGQVVGWSSYTGGIGHHAFRWDNVNGMIDLGTLGGQDSEAHDINESGQIVGTANNHSDHQRAFIWLPEAIPGIPGQEPYELGTFSSRPFAVSEGWGINDATPFQVVGQSETDDPCVGPYIHLGFVWDSEGGMEPLASEGDGPGGEPNESSAAFAINTPPGGLPTVIAGEGSRCGVSANFCGYPGIDAVRWEWDEVNQIFLPRALLQPKGFGEGIGHALDVNDAGQMVGWGRIQPDDCTDHALIWTQAGLSVDVLETDPADEQAYALAINDSASPQIVGRNEDRALAAIWSFAVGDWQYEELDDFISAGCGWALRWARDINDMGISRWQETRVSAHTARRLPRGHQRGWCGQRQ
jgi:probable HAF family extracellular repeat protein